MWTKLQKLKKKKKKKKKHTHTIKQQQNFVCLFTGFEIEKYNSMRRRQNLNIKMYFYKIISGPVIGAFMRTHLISQFLAAKSMPLVCIALTSRLTKE